MVREVSDLLEPCEGRLSSTVLRGEGRSDTTLLPDTAAKCERNFDIDQSRISQMDECHKSEKSQGPIMVMFFCGNGPGTGEKTLRKLHVPACVFRDSSFRAGSVFEIA